MKPLVYISGPRVRELLDWDKTFEAIERAMASVAEKRAFQHLRVPVHLGNSQNVLLPMSGYLSDPKYGALVCKLLTYFPENPKKGEIAAKADIVMLDEGNGDLKAIINAVEVTDWRTAAASAVATKYLHGSGHKNEILAIFGAGVQGEVHAIAFQHFFKFKEVRIWNRTPERAQKLVEELNKTHSDNNKTIFVAYDSAEECVKNADVIVTATASSANTSILKHEWLNLNKNVHINAIRVNPNHFELDDAIYQAANTYVDYNKGAEFELRGLREKGVEFKGQIGDLIAGLVTAPEPNSKTLTVFQSLGMSVEDCAMARMVYDLHLETST